MIRQSFLKTVKPTARYLNLTHRNIASTAARMAEGDTGAPKSGGAAQGDAFSKREAANEDFYVRQKEMERLQTLKQKIEEHKKHLEELEKHVDDTMEHENKK
ncbi:MAG: hypothetical protein Q9182_005904 [Xanthomendoza sp. 2 TL-2023]